MSASSITGRLMKGSAWITASRVIVNLLAALSTVVLAAYLSPADFGLVALGTTILAIAGSVTELSLTQALVRHKEPEPAHFDAVFTMNAARGLIIGALFIAAAYPLADFYREPKFVGVMVALGVSMFIGGLINPRRVMLERNLVFWQDFALNVSQKLAGVLVAIAIAMIYHSYWALVVGQIVSQVVNVAVSYMAAPYLPKLSFKRVGELLSFSVWLTAAQIVNTLNWRSDYLLVGKLLGYTPLGQYSVGSNLATIPTRETTLPLTRTIFPAFSTIVHDPVRLSAGYQRVQAFVTAVALPAGFGCAMIADPLVRLTMGEKWAPAIYIIQVLSAVFALQTLGQLAQPLAMALGQTKILFMRDLQLLCVRTPIVIGAMLLFGLKGMVLARVFSGLLAMVLNLLLVRRFTGLTLVSQLGANLRSVISVLVMSAGMGLAAHFLGSAHAKLALAVHVAALIAVGALLYCGTSTVLWLAMKRPRGPEMEVQEIFGKLTSKLRAA